ncbi:hypothetical protein ACIBI3_25280 [Actinomadura luteofluorescens]|uniref:hypothetical protein n=1 Tax=Actinomadura luteofluorescens TaxID=46163 RepID=UPI0034731546
MDSLRAAGWKFDSREETGTEQPDDGQTAESSPEPIGEAEPGGKEKPEPEKTEVGEPRPAPGAQETPRAQSPREQDGEAVGGTGAESPARPRDTSTVGQDPTDRPAGGEAPPAPAATDQSSKIADTGDPKPGDPANQDAPAPGSLTLDADEPPAEATGSGGEAGGERDGKPAAPPTENTGDTPEFTDKTEPGQPERTPYVDNPGSGEQPSRIASLIAAGWEFPGRTDNTSQPPETTDPKTDAADPETPPPSEQPQPTDNPADTGTPPRPDHVGGTGEEPSGPQEGVPGEPKVEGPAAEPPGDGELTPPLPHGRPADGTRLPPPEPTEHPPPEPVAEPVEGSGTEQRETLGNDTADPARGEQDGDRDKTAQEAEVIPTGPNTLPYLGTYNPNGHFTQTVDQARRTGSESTQTRDTELPPWLTGPSEISQSPTQEELDPVTANREPGVAVKAPDRRKKSETDPESTIERFRKGTWRRGTDMKDFGTLTDDATSVLTDSRPPAPTGHSETADGPTYTQPYTPGATPSSFVALATVAMLGAEGTRKIKQIIVRRAS